MSRNISGAYTPFHHAVLPETIQCAGIDIILSIGHIYIFRYRIYRHTVWFLYLFFLFRQ